jgi:hypothetical protein
MVGVHNEVESLIHGQEVKEREEIGIPTSLSRACLQCPKNLLPGPTRKDLLPLDRTKLGAMSFVCGPSGPLKIQIIVIGIKKSSAAFFTLMCVLG